ncbi:MAG: 3-keto-disaccharide hydrolase [Limisphaerales bacterium]
MKKHTLLSLFCLSFLVSVPAVEAQGTASTAGESLRLFDGKTLQGWEGDTKVTWRVEDGAIVGGSLATKVPRNEFLTSTHRATNFVLKLEFKLLGSEGFINGGVQLRSERATQPDNEMIGYQADIGDGWWGALYDESRRNKPLITPKPEAAQAAVRKQEWNTYLIRCEGPRIRTYINDVPMIDYTETDPTIPLHGLIGLQIHGDGKALIHYRNITLEHLP